MKEFDRKKLVYKITKTLELFDKLVKRYKIKELRRKAGYEVTDVELFFYSNRRFWDTTTLETGVIEIDKNFVYYNKMDDIEQVIKHGLAHLITPVESPAHGDEFRKSLRKLRASPHVFGYDGERHFWLRYDKDREE